MEKQLKLKETEDTPVVVFDTDKNEFSLSGRSLPEDAAGFYRPLIAWMREYAKSPNEQTEFQVKLQYFNSSSVKQVLDLLVILEEIIANGKQAKIIWCYSEDDDLMEIKGREFQGMLNVPFELKVI